MKAEIKKQGKTKVEIDFELSWEEFEVYYQKAINKISQGISLDGFRQGKAPKDIVEQKVGDFKILETAGEIALQENYLKIIKENNLEVIGPPQVEIKKLAKNNEFQAKIKISILPEVNLPDYQKIVSKIEKKKSVVDDKEIEETIKWIQKSRANMQETEGDLPDLNDDFAKTLGNFENLEKLKENIKEGLGIEKENHNKEIWKDDILKAISNEIKIEMPEILVLSEKERIMRNLEHEAEHLKESFEREKLEKQALEMANKRVKNYLILKEIGKRENIEILEKEIEEEINKILASYPQVNPKEIDKESVKSVLYNNKVFNALEKFCDK